MTNKWVHETMDLITFGIPYPAIHIQKDAAWKTLGSTHRTKNHEWYMLYGYEWDFEDCYPKVLRSFFEKMLLKRGANAEELQVWVAHDILDKVWDVPFIFKKKIFGVILDLAAIQSTNLKGLDWRRCPERYDTADSCRAGNLGSQSRHKI